MTSLTEVVAPAEGWSASESAAVMEDHANRWIASGLSTEPAKLGALGGRCSTALCGGGCRLAESCRTRP